MNNDSLPKPTYVNEDAEECLRTLFYVKLQEVFKITRVNSLGQSLTLKLMSGTVNSAKKALLTAAVSGSDIGLDTLSYLKDNYFIRLGTKENQYVMTLFGVWKVEADYGWVNLPDLIKYYDNKFIFKMDEMNDKEKVIIFSLICFGSFSKETPLTRKNIDDQDKSAEAMKKCEEFLVDLGTINPLGESKGASSSTEEEWSQLFRRMTNLPDKTRMVYSGKDNTYYLNLYNHDTDEFNSEGLSFLLWRIFGEVLTPEQENRISEFCQNMMTSYSAYFYDDETVMKTYAYDRIFATEIPDALFDIPDLVPKWK